MPLKIGSAITAVTSKRTCTIDSKEHIPSGSGKPAQWRSIINLRVMNVALRIARSAEKYRINQLVEVVMYLLTPYFICYNWKMKVGSTASPIGIEIP